MKFIKPGEVAPSFAKAFSGFKVDKITDTDTVSIALKVDHHTSDALSMTQGLFSAAEYAEDHRPHITKSTPLEDGMIRIDIAKGQAESLEPLIKVLDKLEGQKMVESALEPRTVPYVEAVQDLLHDSGEHLLDARGIQLLGAILARTQREQERTKEMRRISPLTGILNNTPGGEEVDEYISAMRIQADTGGIIPALKPFFRVPGKADELYEALLQVYLKENQKVVLR